MKKETKMFGRKKQPKITQPVVTKYLWQRGGTIITIESTNPPEPPLHLNVYLLPLIQYLHHNGWTHIE